MAHNPLSTLPSTWDGLVVTWHEWPPGEDVTPLVKGLPNDMCPCPHWGHILSGSIEMKYADGLRETLTAGEAFYMPAGHTAWTERGATFVLFSPEKEHLQVMAHVKRLMASR